MPLPTFATARLTIRPLAPEDLDPLFELIYTDPLVRQHFTNLSEWGAVAASHLIQLAENDNPASGGFGHWTVADRASGAVMGKLLLEAPAPAPWIELDPGSPHLPVGAETELGYAFGQRFWGHGYASEACRALIPHAFGALGLPRLMNSVRRANPASISLMERLGFQIEQQTRRPDFVIGVLTPELYAAAEQGSG